MWCYREEPLCVNVQYSSDTFNSKVFCSWLSITEKGKHLKLRSLLLESCKWGVISRLLEARGWCCMMCPYQEVPAVSSLCDGEGSVHSLRFPRKKVHALEFLIRLMLLTHHLSVFFLFDSQCSVYPVFLYFRTDKKSSRVCVVWNCIGRISSAVGRPQWLACARPGWDGPWAASGERLSKWGLNLVR